MHFVNKLKDGSYQAPRKEASPRQQRTPSQGVPLEKARVFNTIVAAKNSLHQAGLDGEPQPITLMIG